LSLVLLPQCISNPRDANVSFTRIVPLIASSLAWNGKLPSSRKSVWVTYVVEPCLRDGCVCPVSWPLESWDSGVCSASTLGIPAAVHFLSSISEKAVMTKRKITGDKLSPCRTPTVCSMSADSFPILRVTRRSVYNLSMALLNLGGAPYFLRMSMISTWSDVSKALTRSAKTTKVSRLCWRRRWSRLLRV